MLLSAESEQRLDLPDEDTTSSKHRERDGRNNCLPRAVLPRLGTERVIRCKRKPSGATGKSSSRRSLKTGRRARERFALEQGGGGERVHKSDRTMLRRPERKQPGRNEVVSFSRLPCACRSSGRERERERRQSWLPTEPPASTFQRCRRQHKSKKNSLAEHTLDDSVSRCRQGARQHEKAPLHRPPDFFRSPRTSSVWPREDEEGPPLRHSLA